jgi:hypothetical protein
MVITAMLVYAYLFTTVAVEWNLLVFTGAAIFDLAFAKAVFGEDD